MKLDAKNIRYLTAEDWRVLTAVEQGSRNHEVVPTQLIGNISGIAHRTGVHKNIASLAKMNLVSRVKNARYDGYRLTYGGLDYLALHSHLKADAVYSVGNQIGVGKEADIFVVAAPPTGGADASASAIGNAHKLVLKIHRLGRISFRSVKTNRDYLRKKSSGSWMYMSRLAAHKEFSFLQALYQADFPVPRPVGWNRHTVVMDLIDAMPLRQISEVPDPAGLYSQLIELILRFAAVGLIHGDFNEFNILIEEHEVPASEDVEESILLHPVVIDFPQAISIDHANAEFYFNRDVQCIKRFFQRRFGFTSDEEGPFFEDAAKEAGLPGGRRLDVEVEASGFSRKMAKELAAYMKEVGAVGDSGAAVFDPAASVVGEDETEVYAEEDDLDAIELEGGDVEEQPEVVEGAESGETGEPESLPKLTEAADSFEPLSIPELEPALAAVTLDDIRGHPPIHGAPSVAGTARSRRPPANPVKVAKGWAI
ncbi:RIO1-domain-containing protein [Microthyrium microscopicum]|uniref:Serine/threonine-protein kinase RIO2 n=1 Tax=Microthyrium microscopicum TaxID=703497 RepID=A0A6A6UK85_9PEZI|nr:RIO1-domain-containing protein [Microthyrium microscopicum]